MLPRRVMTLEVKGPCIQSLDLRPPSPRRSERGAGDRRCPPDPRPHHHLRSGGQPHRVSATAIHHTRGDDGMDNRRRLGAEVFGTFWLVLGGCGAAVLAGDKIGNAGVAIAFGLTVLTMAYAVGPISGGHFNPAVTLGLAISGRFEWQHLVGYWIAQLVGGILGAAVLYLIVSGKAGFTAGG